MPAADYKTPPAQVRLLLARKLRSLRNTLTHYTAWERARNAAFCLAGFALLYGLYTIFLRLATYLSTIQFIGDLIVWKLTALLMLMTFSMVGLSSLLTALTTLFYAFDLRLLMQAPLNPRAVFAEKSLESAFFASWMIGLVLVPYVLALQRVYGYDAGFLAAFLAMLPPFLLLGASVGLGFTLVLLYLFPSSRTRDVIWVLASFSLTAVYGLIRFAEPERLIRPDALRVVAEYLTYLQAPTARYLPSWWITSALRAWAAGRRALAFEQAVLLWACAAAVYAGLLALSGRLYAEAYSGAQEGPLRRRRLAIAPLPESRWLSTAAAGLLWKERSTFFRDVKHWSQMMLVLGLVFVYLFSIRRLPLDSPDVRSIVSFLNVGTAGFVLAALGLRFTYPSISLEGRSWWVLRAAPLRVSSIMRQKFLFSALPMTALAVVLGAATNQMLGADAFTSAVSLSSLVVIALAVCAMGVGFGALFPMFTVENIHQIESSLGGFVYMTSALFYIGAMVTLLAWPMQMHFEQKLRPALWDGRALAYCALALLVINAAVFILPWAFGARALEAHES